MDQNYYTFYNPTLYSPWKWRISEPKMLKTYLGVILADYWLSSVTALVATKTNKHTHTSSKMRKIDHLTRVI